MRTVSIVDGLGRPLQVKKNAEVNGERKMIVSGMTEFDALSREVAHYHPTTCELSDYLNFTGTATAQLDEVVYDNFDRPLSKSLIRSNGEKYTEKMRYSLERDSLKIETEDALGNRTSVFTDGSDRTIFSIKHHKDGNSDAKTAFDFDGIGQLVSIIDDGGNQTKYEYDEAGRKISVSHPANGKTVYDYDQSGNLLSKTQNGVKIEYKYDFNLLKSINYPNHPENNVTYTYGGVDAEHNRTGRLAMIEDGSGAQEFYYGRMGEVEKIRRTLVIPGQAVATYTTSWKYDSWNRIQEMIYPDGEKVSYFYNFGGQLRKIIGEKNYICTYVGDIRYDEYEQKTLVKYGNGTETRYSYEDDLRRLKNMNVSSANKKFLDNAYEYDKAGNITSVSNSAPSVSNIGGKTSHRYEYDDWNRLVHAHGNFNADGKSAEYHLNMQYDNLYNIVSKKLDLTQTNMQFAGTLKAGHEFSYSYDAENPTRLADIESKAYATDTDTVKTTDFASQKQIYKFDANGNMLSVSTDTNSVNKSFLWDEENRLLAVNNQGSVSSYFYDASGERTVKISSIGESVHVNGKRVGGANTETRFTAYISPYFVVSNGGAYTKHIYAASQRIASKLGNIDGFGADPRRAERTKRVDFIGKFDVQTNAVKGRHEALGFEYDAKDRKSNFDKDSVGYASTGDSKDAEKLVFFYHPDHLGSTSYVTDLDGNVTQHVEYIPYGEVFIEEKNNAFATSYLFNAKELDEETGMYYYGARYLEPQLAMWISVDPLWEKYVGMSPYNYCTGNPVRLVDADGLKPKNLRITESPNKKLPMGSDYMSVIDGGCTPASLKICFDYLKVDYNRNVIEEKRTERGFGASINRYFKDVLDNKQKRNLEIKYVNECKEIAENNNWSDIVYVGTFFISDIDAATYDKTGKHPGYYHTMVIDDVIVNYYNKGKKKGEIKSYTFKCVDTITNTITSVEIKDSNETGGLFVIRRVDNNVQPNNDK